MHATPRAFGRRSFLTTSLLIAGGAVLTGCSSDPMKKNAGDSAGAKITLNQWYHAYGEQGTQDAVKRYAQAYTKANPDVAINITWVAGDYETKLNSSLLTADAPDLFEIGDFRHQMVKNGQLAPLDDILGAAKSEFAKADLDGATVDGKVYGIKMIDDIMMLYYRRSVLDKAGITPPKTYAELVEAARALTTAKMKGLFVGNDGIGDAGYLMAWSAGGTLLEGAKIAFDRPETAAAIGALRQLHDSKSLLLDFTTDWFDPGALTQKATAMHWCGLWAMPDIKKSLGDDFGVVPWPAFGASGRPTARLGGWYELVNAKSKHVEAAKKYVQWLWLQQADLQKDWCVSYGFHVPPRASVAAQTTEFGAGAPKEAVAISQKYGTSFPNLWNTAMATAFNDAVTKIAKQHADPAAALAKATAACQAELDKQLG
ncbi:sugar ABC transporter substrate-binding protein [Streptomyces sp. APSN-46.1]|uniref:ABC transporter substrate-binding protein n=1 Tax=Streptomyces sp. APSN-46.1 TaxID=2929049 RepID=UPI001FB43EF3|nr:sugar ABC transporter substrate-binding protein [Streptomyces sp. APSN-46.1]MCJ1676150.1 sugar ABC transporter substrate-binding protein [Streptomyces sp. APSN-46.1]